MLMFMLRRADFIATRKFSDYSISTIVQVKL